MQRVLLSWSSGKDSALSLLRLQQQADTEVVGLFTTYHQDEVPFQATPIEVVELQAQRLALPLIKIPLPQVFPATELYQQLILDALGQSELAFDALAFGDIYCNGIVEYRQRLFAETDWECLFPLLKQDSLSLANEVIASGIDTLITTVDTEQLSNDYLGQPYTQQFIASLPEGCDVCGEVGEFHSLVTNMPGFSSPIDIELTEQSLEGRFHHQRYKLRA